MAFATKVLDTISAITILVAGIYVEIAFAHLFSNFWKLVVAGLVLVHVAAQTRRILLASLREPAGSPPVTKG